MWPFKPREHRNLAPIFLTNTRSGEKERFVPLRSGMVSLYSCGPTVYGKQHIGNLRPYILSDTIARVLKDAGYHVRRVINITDVGHLVGDGDDGEDKMLVGAARERTSTKTVAERYATMFLEDIDALNVDVRDILFPKATDYIREQIAMVEALEKGGHTYKTKDGIYFDTSTFPNYGTLGNANVSRTREYALADIGRRIKENKEKRHAADFALWKFSPAGVERLQEWRSPWGTGFPGWHIECSAMAKALLGDQLDIHTGGIDHIPVHHNNEIAQTESITGKPFVKYWMHQAFISIEGEKISKSLGNDIYLSDIAARGHHPLSLRYLYLQAHYSTPLSFSWDSVAAADEALKRLWKAVARMKQESKGVAADSDAARRLIAVVREDLATPQALALLWEALGDDTLSTREAWGVIAAADRILGLSLTEPPELDIALAQLPPEVRQLADEREQARKSRDFARSDELRIHIEERGYHVEDTASGPVFSKSVQ